MRTEYDETWEKQPDGTMKLLSRVPREVSAEQEELDGASEALRALAKKKTLTQEEVAQAVRLILLTHYSESGNGDDQGGQ